MNRFRTLYSEEYDAHELARHAASLAESQHAAALRDLKRAHAAILARNTTQLEELQSAVRLSAKPNYRTSISLR